MNVMELYRWIDARAPFDTQLDFDNAGLLTGSPDTPITAVHFALDATDASVREAIAAGAEVLVTHHPLMFSPIQSLREDRPEAAILCLLIRHRIALISAHTNLDRAPGGINDVLAERIGLTDIRGEDFIRVGRLPEPMSAKAFAEQVGQRLNTVVRIMGREDRLVSSVGLCSGAGGDEWTNAGAIDAFVTGECKHHHAMAAAAAGVTMLECGHFATEEPGIFALADALQKDADALQWRLRITKSRCGGYPEGPRG